MQISLGVVLVELIWSDKQCLYLNGSSAQTIDSEEQSTVCLQEEMSTVYMTSSLFIFTLCHF